MNGVGVTGVQRGLLHEEIIPFVTLLVIFRLMHAPRGVFPRQVRRPGYTRSVLVDVCRTVNVLGPPPGVSRGYELSSANQLGGMLRRCYTLPVDLDRVSSSGGWGR